jgi:hypothetical protein
MKKLLLLMGLSLLFLVSCNDDNKTTDTTNDNNQTTSEVTNESSQEENNKTNEKSTDEENDSNKESSETQSTTEPTQGNVENGGGYKDDSGEEWIFLG